MSLVFGTRRELNKSEEESESPTSFLLHDNMLRLASVLLLLLLTCQFIAQAADSTCIHSRDEPSADGRSKRSLFKIVFECISTTIICAWAAIHPNIPPPEGPFKGILRRLELMFLTIVAPEILPTWALNQRLAAMTIRDLYNKEKGYKEESCGIWKSAKRWFSLYERKETPSQPWTLTHGHFLIMGGIHLVEPVEINSISTSESGSDDVAHPTASTPLVEGTNSDAEKGPHTPGLKEGRVTILTLEMLRVLVKDPEIEIQITEDEITDKSKGDALSKLIFMLQTSWFIVQCIARVAQGLNLTQLELTTLAMASLNGITWILWWEKPLGARSVLRVYVNRKLTDEERNVKRPDINQASQSNLASALKTRFESTLTKIHDTDWSLICVGLIFLPLAAAIGLPILIIAFLWAVSVDLLFGAPFPAEATHVSTFYVPSHKHDRWPLVLLIAFGSIFGGIHCAGWNIPFPTYDQQHLWRVASLGVTIIPIALVPLFFVIAIITKVFVVLITSSSDAVAGGVGVIVCICSIFVYAAARLVLLAQAVILLRHLPPSALIAVDWTQYYPHIF